MPLNVRRFLASAAFLLSGFALADAQTVAPVNSPPTTTAQNTPVTTKIAAPTSAEIMRERISKAKAFIAVKNYNAAIYELENIRRETGDQTVHGVINVLLMHSYLEQSDYTRAQAFLKELYNPQKSAKPIASAHYFAAAGQVVKGARNQLERYRSLGLTVSDRSLPLEASVDIEKMRETLELVVEQSKTIGVEKSKTADAMALLEEATASRGNLAKDDYDAKRWKDEIGDAREKLTSSRSVITNAVNEPPTETPVVSPDSVASIVPTVNSAATNPKPIESAAVFKPVATEVAVAKPNTSDAKPNTDSTDKTEAAKTAVKTDEKPKEQPRKTDETAKANETPTTKPENNENKTAPEQQTAKNATTNDGSPLKVGSLVGYATNQAKPVYPMAAKNMRMGGIVKVEVLVNESGEVTEVQNTTGPPMLQRAAVDAMKKWKFKPFVKDGQPTKASGFVNFNFAL
ncbi:MAG: TonB family protein [Pyrinomonadaceae bacterium]